MQYGHYAYGYYTTDNEGKIVWRGTSSEQHMKLGLIRPRLKCRQWRNSNIESTISKVRHSHCFFMCKQKLAVNTVVICCLGIKIKNFGSQEQSQIVLLYFNCNSIIQVRFQSYRCLPAARFALIIKRLNPLN